jgi:hypothetical protein
MKILAVKAVRRGLSDTSDNHKAGNLGVSALRGLGEFEQAGNTVNVAAIINSIPPGMRERYLSSADLEPEIGAIADATKTGQESADEE